jgi:hypothetical protein
MGEVVNLRLARKRKARAEKAQAADENRARFGRTSAARVAERLDKELETRRLDAHRRASGVPDEPDGGPEGEAGA